MTATIRITESDVREFLLKQLSKDGLDVIGDTLRPVYNYDSLEAKTTLVGYEFNVILKTTSKKS